MLYWFTTHQAAYWWIAWGASTMLIAQAIAPLLPERYRCAIPTILRSEGGFVFSLLTTLAAFRWPALFFKYELNPDESQFVAGAITLAKHPVFWDSVNGTTSGPLNFYALFLGRLLLLPFDYLSARITGLVLVAVALFAIYRVLRRYYGAAARVGVLPLWGFFAFAVDPDFVHYSSEHVPLALLALGLSACGTVLIAPPPSGAFSWRCLAGAIALGAAALGKLQSGPIAAAVLLAACALFLRQPAPWPDRIRRFVELTIGSALPALFFGGIALASGVGTDAWLTFIFQNVIYTGSDRWPLREITARFWEFTRAYGSIHPFLIGAALFAALASLFLPFFRSRDRQFIAFAGVATAAAWMSVVAPGKPFGHYLLLLVVPAGMLVGGLWGSWWHQEKPAPMIRSPRFIAVIAFAAFCFLPQVFHRIAHPNPYIGHPAWASARPTSAVAEVVTKYANKGEPMGHWGWMSRYYVETQTTQATREANSYLQICPSPLRDYFRTRYLERFSNWLPPVFVDSVGPGNFFFTNPADAHECFPALADLIRTRYTLVAERDGSRIYARNDRISSLPPGNEDLAP